MNNSSTRIALFSLGLSALTCLFLASSATAELVVTTSPVFFNPSIGRSAKIHVAASRPGEIVVEILDRDRFPVRALGTAKLADSAEIAWDGKDDSGAVVPNEAYSVRIRFTGSDGSHEVYEPASAPDSAPIAIDEFSYSRVDGVLNYRLSTPSRVHIQAGQRPPAKSIGSEGPILQTVVDRAPRTGGAISEKWSGFDDSRAVYIPDLPDFVMAILASPLPANALITTGSRGESFAAYAARRRPVQPSLREQVFGPEFQHHQGLTALQDRSPRLSAKLLSGEDSKSWNLRAGEKVQALVGFESTLEPIFLAPRARLYLFSDATLVATQSCDRNPCPIELPSGAFPAGQHRLVANWDSGLGPVGVAVKIVETK